ncbi:MAG: altronate dehydratase, partial [Mucilaginibacter sp.]|nr:altronate dehydratase [Mucilaginibacter sp.]
MSTQKETYLRIHPHDNVLVALQDLPQGTVIAFDGQTFTLVDKIAAKHKFAINELPVGKEIYMYGVLVGK